MLIGNGVWYEIAHIKIWCDAYGCSFVYPGSRGLLFNFSHNSNLVGVI